MYILPNDFVFEVFTFNYTYKFMFCIETLIVIKVPKVPYIILFFVKRCFRQLLFGNNVKM